MALLSVRDLAVNYSSNQVVKKCSFDLKPGEIIVVLGSSGDGKTTLLKAIAGLLPRATGDILFNGEHVNDPTEQLVPGHPHIKLVNQDFSLNEFHTVEENIRLRLLSFDEAYQKKRIKSLLRLTSLTRFRDVKANEISGGQGQRLAIARALADEPDLILLDEPFNQLDFQTKNKIATHIKRYLKQNNIGAIMVTHNGLEAMEWADRILFMKNGKLLRDDSPMAFYNSPKTLQQARFFGVVNKVKLAGKELFFRPSFYQLEPNEQHKIKIELNFKSRQHVGWYSEYYFMCGKHSVTLYSTSDISHIKSIFIRTISIK